MNKIVLVLILGALIAGCVQPQGKAIEKTSSGKYLSNAEHQGDSLHVLTIDIRGLSCPACPKGISSFLMELDGVVGTEITLEQKGGTIVYDSTKITAEEIVNSEIFQGVFKAEIIDDRPIKDGA